jgi:hypothetical protein
MNTQEYRALSKDEKNALIAQEVEGYTSVFEQGVIMVIKDGFHFQLPNYLEDMNLCMELVKSLPNVRTYQLTWFKGRDKNWFEFDLHMDNDDIFSGEHETDPEEAICLSVLRAEGVIDDLPEM